jgi:hypothetical protein
MEALFSAAGNFPPPLRTSRWQNELPADETNFPLAK